jgi:hypothetical protein
LYEFHRGLQCGLSGNLVPSLATRRKDLKGKPPWRRRSGGLWENLLDLSHNFYSMDTSSYINASVKCEVCKENPSVRFKVFYTLAHLLLFFMSFFTSRFSLYQLRVIQFLNLKAGRAVKIALLTFTISLLISYTFQFSLVLWVSGLILLVILLTGIIFDIIGTAATAASEVPFHAMGADKIKGSKQALYLIRHADKVASFCNDVVGDISGTVNGAMVASISFTLVKMVEMHFILPDKLIGAVAIAFIAALTVGGKSLGKSYAINNANQIIFSVGKLLYFFKFDGFKSSKHKHKAGVNSRKVRKG